MITSDTQQIEQLIHELREHWAHAGTTDGKLTLLRQMCLTLANDRADARELADDRLVIIGQQARALDAQLGHLARQDRRLKTIELTVNSIEAPSWHRIDAIREILKTPIEVINEQ